MELRPLLSRVWQFLTHPVSPLPLGIYRCLFGLLALASGGFLAPDLLIWFGSEGIFSHAQAAQSTGLGRVDLFAWFGSSNTIAISVFSVFMMSALFTAFGLFSRVATALLFLTVTSLHHRNIYILHSGDTIIRLMAFFLMLAPSGAAFSLDRVWRVYKGIESPGQLADIPPTAFRLMQLQLCLIYFSTGFWKATGGMWMDGTAVFVVNQIGQFERFPIPDFMRSLWFSKTMSWYTLAAELAAPFLLWFKETRLFMLAGLVLLHGGLEYTMNIQLFQAIIISVFVLFVSEQEIRNVWGWVGKKLSSRANVSLQVLYNASDLDSLRQVHTLKNLDLFGLVTFTSMSPAIAHTSFIVTPEISDTPRSTAHTARAIALRLPLLFPFGILAILPGATSLTNFVLRLYKPSQLGVATATLHADGQSKPPLSRTKHVS